MGVYPTRQTSEVFERRETLLPAAPPFFIGEHKKRLSTVSMTFDGGVILRTTYRLSCASTQSFRHLEFFVQPVIETPLHSPSLSPPTSTVTKPWKTQWCAEPFPSFSPPPRYTAYLFFLRRDVDRRFKPRRNSLGLPPSYLCPPPTNCLF